MGTGKGNEGLGLGWREKERNELLNSGVEEEYRLSFFLLFAQQEGREGFQLIKIHRDRQCVHYVVCVGHVQEARIEASHVIIRTPFSFVI